MSWYSHRDRLMSAVALIVMLVCAGGSPRAASAQLPGTSTGSLVAAITSPASGSTVGGPTMVNANVTIVGSLTVAGVQFKLDGNNLGAEDTSSPYQISWNTTSTTNGWHTLTAVARDMLGVRWTSDPVAVQVFNDVTPPSVTIEYPIAGTSVAGTITVSAIASDNVGVAGVQFKLDGANLGAEDTTNWFSVSWDTTQSSNGQHTLTAVARDAAGNRSTSAPVTVTVDNIPPTVAITFPGNGAAVASVITVRAAATDNIGVAGVQFQLDGVNQGFEDVTAPYEAAWDTTQFSDGQHALTAVARDAAGNRTASAPVRVVVDNTRPAVAIIAPGPGTVSGTVDVSANASDNIGVVGVQFFVDTTTLLGDDTATPYTASWNTTTVSNGSHTLTAVARDAAGNRTASAGVVVTVSNPPPPPPDSTPPTVAITSPTSGETVSGTIPVQADAFDDVGVVGVQFFMGTTLLGDDTAAPYAVSWDTTTASNGSHGLTAVARDAAGNRTPSSVVTVTVSNPSPPPAEVKRFEERDPSISFTGTWDLNTDRTWSGGFAGASGTVGSTATFTFTGPSMNWIGFRCPICGIARVAIDGGTPADVDLYSSTEEVRAVVYTAGTDGSLTNTTHTLTITVTGLKNPASTGPFVVLDAFDVPSQTVARIQQTDPSVTYTGTWIRENTDRPYTGGTAAEATAAGATATFTFTGTSVTWIGARGPSGGTARVYLDGTFVIEVDAYATSEGIQAVMYFAGGLARTTHTLTIEVTGLRNPAATNNFIIVDAFEVTF